jgi:N-acyl-D-aspartate/D-glutamate deacylase
LVAPGWLDIHTHYDGQATWDPLLDPSFSSGVTTAIMGNCGVGFAPIADGMQERLIELMEGVEEVPGTALHIGLKWNWRTFPEYLDVLDAMPRSFDIGALMPHGPLRLWAMGDKVGTNKCACDEELTAMVDAVQHGMRAGAFGLATSRTPLHRTVLGEMTPDYHVDAPELIALAAAVRDRHGYLEIVPDGIGGESLEGLRSDMSLVNRIVNETGVNLHMLVFQNWNDPTFYREQIAQLARLNNNQTQVTIQFAGRAGGAIMSFLGPCHPFADCPTYKKIARLPLDHWLTELAKPEIRTQILSEENPPGSPGAFFARYFCIFDLGPDMDYEPELENSVSALASRKGCDPRAFAYDLLLEHSEVPRVYIALSNYHSGNLDAVWDTLSLPSVVLGASDAGAHVLTVCDGSIHSFMLTHWARDRLRGRHIPVEQLVHLMTQKTALSVGLTDRGVLAPGKKADINVIDYNALRLHRPRFYPDLPGGARRIMQKVTGYRATVVSGQVTREHDVPTGVLPGRLLRHGHVNG